MIRSSFLRLIAIVLTLTFANADESRAFAEVTSNLVERKTQGKKKSIFPMKGKNCGKLREGQYETKKLSWKSGNVWICRNLCLQRDDCEAIEYNGVKKQCNILFYKPWWFGTVYFKPEESFCGRVKVERIPTPAPIAVNTPAPTTAPTTTPTKHHGKSFNWKPYTKCDGVINWKEATRYDNFVNIDQCIMKCGQTFKCKTFFYNEEAKACIVMEYRVLKIVPSERQEGKILACGKLVRSTKPPTTSPTITSTMTPTALYESFFDWRPYTKCVGDVIWTKAKRLEEIKDVHACMSECYQKTICKTFFYNPKTQICTLMDYRVRKVEKVESEIGPEVVCGKKRRPPTKAPVIPTKPPTLPPTPRPTNECIIQAKLGHPFEKTDDAPYYGYHADSISVTRDGNAIDECSYYYDTEWCTYSVTNNGDSAFFWANPYYEYSFLSEETATIMNARDKVFHIKVKHYFSDEEAYYDPKTKKEWLAYLLAAKLKVFNKNKPDNVIKDGNGKSMWSHPVTKGIEPYVEVNGVLGENDNYEGEFTLKVTCSKFCFCTAEYSLP